MTGARSQGRGALAVLLAAALGACAPENSLEGSLGEVLDLEFTATEVAITESAVIVGYYRPHLDGRDVVFKLVTYVAPGDLVPGETLDLTPAPDGAPRAAATRSVADDPIRTYAAIKTGRLTLDRPLVIDEPASGSFRVTLGEGGDAGKGRTAFGTFRVDRVSHGN